MTALEDAVAALQQAVNDANSRFQNVGDLQNALDAERMKYSELVTSENAEDVQQSQELADARAATDAAVAQLSSVAGVLTGLTDQVNQLGRQASEATAGATTPAESAPAEAAPVDQTPADANVVQGDPNAPTNQPASDQSAPTNEAAPAEAAPGAPVNNAPEGADSTDVTNMRPNL